MEIKLVNLNAHAVLVEVSSSHGSVRSEVPANRSDSVRVRRGTKVITVWDNRGNLMYHFDLVIGGPTTIKLADVYKTSAGIEEDEPALI